MLHLLYCVQAVFTIYNFYPFLHIVCKQGNNHSFFKDQSDNKGRIQSQQQQLSLFIFQQIYLTVRAVNQNFLILFCMQNGHRRTQSDDFYIKKSMNKVALKLRLKLTENHICELVSKANKNHKNKTVFVQSLDAPELRSDQDSVFNFGKIKQLTPSLVYSHRQDEELASIPEKKSHSQLAIRQSNAKLKSNSCRKKSEEKPRKKAKEVKESLYLNSPYFVKSSTKETKESDKKTKPGQLKLNFKARNNRITQKCKKLKPLTLRTFK